MLLKATRFQIANVKKDEQLQKDMRLDIEIADAAESVDAALA